MGNLPGLSLLDAMSYVSPSSIQDPSIDSVDSDLWSLGITMIVILTGSHPYPQRKGLSPLMSAIVNQPHPVLDAQKFSTDLCDFVSACLNQPPGDSTSASRLLNHTFILAAKECDVISDNTQARLSIPCSQWYNDCCSFAAISEKIVRHAVKWQLDQKAQSMKVKDFTIMKGSYENIFQGKFPLCLQKWLAEQLGGSSDDILNR